MLCKTCCECVEGRLASPQEGWWWVLAESVSHISLSVCRYYGVITLVSILQVGQATERGAHERDSGSSCAIGVAG